MPFISQKTLEELRRDARNGQDIKKLEKKFNKETTKIRNAYYEREEDLIDEHEAEVRTLERAARKVSEAVKEATATLAADHKVEIANLTRGSKAALAAKSDEVVSLTDKIKVLDARVLTAAALTKRELDIKDKEDEATRAAELVSNREKALEKKIKEFDARVLDENETQYKTGFTDGVAATLYDGIDRVAEVQKDVVGLANKALDKDTVVITTTQTPAKSK